MKMKKPDIHPSWIEAAEEGNAEAQYNLAFYYYPDEDSKGDERLYKKYIYWLMKAADQGYARAQFELGCDYNNGERGVEKDKRKAIELWSKAADQGHSEAQCFLDEENEK